MKFLAVPASWAWVSHRAMGSLTRGQVPGGGVTADPSCQALSAMKVSATNLALCIRKDAATSGRTSSPAAIRDTCDFDGA